MSKLVYYPTAYTLNCFVAKTSPNAIRGLQSFSMHILYVLLYVLDLRFLEFVILKLHLLNTQKAVAVFVQHVPRINGEIPSVDEATLDHQRLLDRSFFFIFIFFVNGCEIFCSLLFAVLSVHSLMLAMSVLLQIAVISVDRV